MLPFDPSFLQAASLRVPFQVQRARSGNLSGVSTVTTTLANNPAVGSLMVAFVGSNVAAVLTHFQDPGGWTVVDSDQTSGAGTGWKLYAKTSAGSGDKSFTVTFDTNVGVQVEYQEWANAAPLASAFGTRVKTANNGAVTTIDPASSTPSIARSAFFAGAVFSAGTGTVTTPWVGADANDGTTTAINHSGWKVVQDGSAWDTSMSWTTGRAVASVVVPIVGV